jgi:hypothetical protein
LPGDPGAARPGGEAWRMGRDHSFGSTLSA